MKKIFMVALCVGLFITANSVWAQQGNKARTKAKVENAEKKTTATKETTKACCADKKACCDATKAGDKKACCDAAKAGDKKACCTTKLSDSKAASKVACDKKVTTCSANKVAPVENKSSGKK